MQPITITISDKEILDLLSNYDSSKRELMIIKALKVGLIALKDIETVGNVDYVEKEFQKFKGDLDKEFLQRYYLRSDMDFRPSEQSVTNLVKEMNLPAWEDCRNLNHFW